MKKFIYEFEAILQLKMKQEEQAKNEYGIRRAKLTEEEELLELLCRRRDGYQEEKRRKLEDTLSIKGILRCEEAVEVMKYKITLQRVEVKKAEQAVEEALERMTAAILERKTYGRLREKAFEEYCIEYEHEEQKLIDERNSYVFAPKIIRQKELA